MTRVYIPATLPGLAGFMEAGAIPASVDRFSAADESEEAEYDALSVAGEDAAALLTGPGRRTVVVADVTDVDAAIRLDQVVAVHADTEDIDPGSADLPDLGWFATQEIPDLL